MPDIRTEHPGIVRDLLGEGGFTCGVPARVLEGRDPDWTCVVDGNRISGDLYIHQADDPLLPDALTIALLLVLAVAVVCQMVALIWLWRRGRAARPQSGQA